MTVDIRKIAAERGIKILMEGNPTNVRGTAFQMHGKWYITVDPNDTIERQNFTIAHELAEIELNDEDNLTLDEKHRLADMRAGEMLLQEKEIKEKDSMYSLTEWKNQFPYCSQEVIARRSLQFQKKILTIYDNKKFYLRIASDGLTFPYKPSEIETQTIEECYQLRDTIEKTHENLALKAYFVDEGQGVERVLLFTEVIDDFL